MINISFVGYLGKDAKIIEQENGRFLVLFNVAVNNYRNKDKDGKCEPVWINCSYFADDTEKGVTPFLVTGKEVFISGKVRKHTAWVSDDTGEVGSSLYVDVDAYRDIELRGGGDSDEKPTKKGKYDDKPHSKQNDKKEKESQPKSEADNFTA